MRAPPVFVLTSLHLIGAFLMPLELSEVASLERAVIALDLLSAVDTPWNPNVCARRLGEMFAPADRDGARIIAIDSRGSGRRNIGLLLSGIVAYRTVAGDCVVVFGGTRDGYQTRFALGYGQRSQMAAYDGFNASVGGDIVEGLGTILRPCFEGATRFFLYGYSSGGVYAEGFAAALHKLNDRLVVELQTFGAPSPGLTGCCAALTPPRRRRWMFTGDAVPNIPGAFNPGDNAAILVLWGLGYRPEQITQPNGGLRIQRNGTFYEFNGPQTVPGNAARQIQAWIDGIASDENEPHSLINYRTALRSALRNARSPNPPPPSPSPQIPLEFPIRRPGPFPPQPPGAPPATTATPRDGTFRVPNFPNVQIPSTRIPQMPQAKIAPNMRFTAGRINRQYNVFLNDFLVASFTTFSKAKTFAKAGNRFLRNMGNVNPVYGTVLGEAFTSWCGIASQGGGGVVPPIINS